MAFSSKRMSGRRLRVVAVFAVLGASMAVVPAKATSPAHGACERPVFVAGQGWSCPAPGGWTLYMPDGATFFTRGPDRLPAGQALNLTAAPLKPSCATAPSTQFHLRVIYAHADDKPSRYTSLLYEIRKMVEIANGALNDEAKIFGRTLRYRVYCSAGEVSVTEVRLPVTQADATLEDIMAALRQMGHTNPFAKYMVWFDGTRGSLGGIATFLGDDSASASNQNNLGAQYAVVFGRRLNGPGGSGPLIVMHEGSHAMGAVQLSSPNTTKGGHCIDGLDVMCYPDEGSLASLYTDDRCSAVRFDCGHDDYFHPNPSTGNYLATHWNIGSPLNRFVAGCAYATGVLTAGAGGQESEGTTSKTFAISSSCSGRRFAVSGVFALPPQQVTDAGVPWDGLGPWTPSAVTLQRTVTPDMDVCFLKGAAVLSCAQEIGTDQGKIPSGATHARVVLKAGAQALWVFNAV